jgi:hypothetical protein
MGIGVGIVNVDPGAGGVRVGAARRQIRSFAEQLIIISRPVDDRDINPAFRILMIELDFGIGVDFTAIILGGNLRCTHEGYKKKNENHA